MDQQRPTPAIGAGAGEPLEEESKPSIAPIHYSRGRRMSDAYPAQRTAASFDAFAEAVLSDRSPAKGLIYICAPVAKGSDGQHHRSRDGALDRRFLSLDLDGSTPTSFVEVCLFMTVFRGFGYTTASHTNENPRARFVLELSRPVSRDDGIRLGAAMQRTIEERTAAVQFDPSIYRAEQPMFSPLYGAAVMRYDGDPVDVDLILMDAPTSDEPPGLKDRIEVIARKDPIIRALAAKHMIKRDHGDGMLSIVCPFAGEHTEPGGESSTAYLLPHFNGVATGQFKCLHTHCKGRERGEFLAALGVVTDGDASSQARHEPGPESATASALDYHVNQPAPDPGMLYGLAGEVGRIAAETTEANEYAVAVDFLTFLSAMAGRDVYLPVGNTWHHARLSTLHVGRSGRGRKGDALSLVHRIRHAIQEANKTLLGQTHIGGLSTREGLALLIHDGFKIGKQKTPPIDDKRLWVVESEFSNILHQGKRDGNTLSSALRDAWDGVSIRPAIKSARVWASDPHIALSGSITPSELLSVIERRELTNGFASRILIFWAERKRLVEDPAATPAATIKAIAGRTAEVIRFAKGDYPMMRNSREMSLGDDAKKLYAKLYRGELNRYADGEILTALLERRAPMLLRLAMLFALTDLTLTIGAKHINGALAWVRYWGESVRFVFSDMADTEGAVERGELGEQIIDFLKKRGEADRRAINRDCFSSHVSAMKIDGALDDLLTAVE